jgi:hypothetical protein
VGEFKLPSCESEACRHTIAKRAFAIVSQPRRILRVDRMFAADPVVALRDVDIDTPVGPCPPTPTRPVGRKTDAEPQAQRQNESNKASHRHLLLFETKG